ncbi:hydroxylysine kinase [Agrilus planipennis]|uniref:Hydroxylysine kinase n=1 Tax=Agrilus planipennis TaxID=224129 RepID=A0A1W4XBT9_AGRPL|nr:hydroxylysine kinase [Agrilus planipennis]
MIEQNILQPGQSIKPEVTKDASKTMIKDLYSLNCDSIKELNGYDDKNYIVSVTSVTDNAYIEKISESGYVLKILNSLDSKNPCFIEAQTSLLIFLNENNVHCPKPVKNKYGQYFYTKKLQSGYHIIRLLEFIPGKLLHEIPVSNNLSFEIGIFVGKLDKILQGFDNPVYQSHSSIWMLNSVPRLKEFTFAIKEDNKLQVFLNIINNYEEKVLKNYDKFRKGLIHGDINEQNLIVDGNSDTGWFVSAIIDFGDSHYSCYLFEIAIAMTYIMLTTKTLESGGFVLAGYLQNVKLSDLELSLLKICIEARLTQSLMLGAYSFLKDPENHYILTTAREGWNLLERLRSKPDEELLKTWRNVLDIY